MSRTNSQAKIVSDEQLVPRANRLVFKKKNQRVALDSHITHTMLRFVVEILRHHKLYNPFSLIATVMIIYQHQFWTTINHNKNNHAFTFELDNHTFTLTPGPLRTVLHMPPPDPNNTYIQPYLEIQILEFIKTLGYDEDPDTKSIVVSKMVTTRLHQPWRAILSSANLDFASLIWDEFEWKTVERSSRPSKISKLLYTRFTKLIIDYLLSLNKSIPYRSDSKLHSSQDDHPITKLLSTTNGEYKFGMEVLGALIKEQHVSLIKSGRGKGFMCYGDQVANVPNRLKKDAMPRKTRSLTIAEEVVVGEGSSATHNKYYSSSDTASDATLYSSSLDELKGSAYETNDADESYMELSHDNPHGDDDDARYGVCMDNKSNATPNSTYLSLMVTSSSLDFIQTLLDETPKNVLTGFMSHPVYTDAQTTTVVHNP
ncbi:hypothetical protein Tco_1503397 [Tanacetum coccineum]